MVGMKQLSRNVDRMLSALSMVSVCGFVPFFSRSSLCCANYKGVIKRGRKSSCEHIEEEEEKKSKKPRKWEFDSGHKNAVCVCVCVREKH